MRRISRRLREAISVAVVLTVLGPRVNQWPQRRINLGLPILRSEYRMQLVAERANLGMFFVEVVRKRGSGCRPSLGI